MRKKSIITTMDSEGNLSRVKPDGTLEPVTVSPLPPMSDEEINAAALSDPDAIPLTEEDLAKLRPIPRIKSLRRALHLTQEAFAARYHIPIGTLRDWEQGRVVPDSPAQAYLRVIATDPEGVKRALEVPRPS